MDRIKLSKKLSYFLRHHPEKLDLEIDRDGFTKIGIGELAQRLKVSPDDIREVVRKDKKRRFTISNDRIRANYGHSIPQGSSMYESENPISSSKLPQYLYHGTAPTSVPNILQEGLQSKNREFVHLSYTQKWAIKVGSRHAVQPKIIRVAVSCCLKQGIVFYDGGPTTVLTTEIPAKCLELLDENK